jgi:hypothetical protein
LTEKESIKSSRSKSIASRQNPTAILIVCMGIAVLLWLTNKLSHEYNGELTVQLNYVNIPEDNILGGKTTGQLILEIKAKGFNLLWYKLKRNKLTIDMNMNKLPLNRQYVLTNRLKPEVSSRIPKEYELIAILPDTLYYALDKKFSKKVPVVFNAELNYERQYGLSGKIILSPDEIVISGPKKEITSVEKWETEPVTFNKLKETKEGTVKLKQPEFTNAKIEPDKIQYKIPVEEFTEQEVEVELKAINVPKKLNLILYPKKIKIACLVSLKDFDKVKPSLFKVIVDFSEHDFEKEKYAEIKVVQSPDFVKHIHFSPKKAEYIIHK